ncbi:MAG: hypothetical protein KME45_17690 [Stenomitos rutilans HA7619-LM2]|jgi:hypothetical protein|nr:hypothetical protein [Stenomitos rutilans HA7619-LM2]
MLYDLDFMITELGCLYAYVAEDFEAYFSLVKELEGVDQRNKNKMYVFEKPSSCEKLRLEVQQKFPPNK